MDYYQKYQKYKYKYYNLLNQFGGDDEPYTETDFNLLDKYKYNYLNNLPVLSKLINKDGYLKDKSNGKLLEDFITTEHIHITKAVLIDKHVRDVDSILKTIHSNYTKNPMTNENFTITNLLNIQNQLEKEIDKKTILYLIISQLNSDIKQIVLSLDTEQLKILLNKNKIDIFNTSDIYYVTNLLNNYKTLLSHNITDSDIIKAVSSNGIALILVPEYKKNYQICLKAVTQNGLALKYVPEDIKFNDICKEAVTKNGLALKYVPKKNKNADICKIAVEKNGLALEYVIANNMTNDKYFEICKSAVTQNGTALIFILADKITKEQFNEIRFLAKIKR
jgi:hypothetical protein